MNSEEPEAPPITGIQAVMISAHEAYLSAREAGFTRGQALYLAAVLVSGGPLPPRGADSGT